MNCFDERYEAILGSLGFNNWMVGMYVGIDNKKDKCKKCQILFKFDDSVHRHFPSKTLLCDKCFKEEIKDKQNE